MRDSKMTVSTSNIWKSAAAAVRQPVRAGDDNLHIGKTLRDLYFEEDMPKTEGHFADLLSRLNESQRGGD